MEIPWIIEEQTQVKHELLRQYLSSWMIIFFRNQARYDNMPEVLLYFDGFAGPGIYFTDDSKSETCSGSPIIVAEMANSFINEKTSRKVKIFCIDREKEIVDMLKEKLETCNCHNQDWRVYHAEFSEKINDIIAEIKKKRLHLHPLFFFIDPFGYKGYPINVLKSILQYPRAELFINFMIYDIVRFCETEQKREIMANLFGCNDFLKVDSIDSPEDKQLFLKNLFCQQLKAITGVKYVMPFRINTPGQSMRPRFYMIHASNHIKALKVMKDRMASVSDKPYQFTAIGLNPDQMTLFDDPEKIKLTDRLKDHCRKHAEGLEYSQIEDWAYEHTCGVANTIKTALVDLEKQGTVTIKRKPRQRKNTVTKGAIIYPENVLF